MIPTLNRFLARRKQRKIERYVLGLFTEECGEVQQCVGKALRFGIDTPGVKDNLTGEVKMDMTPRTELAKELGDIMAAIDYAVQRGVIDEVAMTKQRHKKLNKLVDPNAKDNLGRRLAP